MSITIQIPSAMRHECGGKAELSISELGLAPPTVRAALAKLEQDYPAVYRSTCDETGAVRRHIHLFVNSIWLNGREGLDRAIAPGDVLSIMTAVSGG